MSTETTPTEDVYRVAADRAADIWYPASPPDIRARHIAEWLAASWFRAAVDAAYAAGYREGYYRGRDDEADALPTPPEVESRG